MQNLNLQQTLKFDIKYCFSASNDYHPDLEKEIFAYAQHLQSLSAPNEPFSKTSKGA